jgi:hypothetical protein
LAKPEKAGALAQKVLPLNSWPLNGFTSAMIRKLPNHFGHAQIQRLT